MAAEQIWARRRQSPIRLADSCLCATSQHDTLGHPPRGSAPASPGPTFHTFVSRLRARIKTGTDRVGPGWAGMAGPLVSDALWREIAPPRQSEPPKPKGGRPRRVPDRACLEGIVSVLRTGIGWERPAAGGGG